MSSQRCPNLCFFCLWFRHLPVETAFISIVSKCDCYEVSGDVCGLAEQRSNQSEFSFELEELSIKFAGIKEPLKKAKLD